MKRVVLTYSLKIWLTSVLIAPIIILIVTSGMQIRGELAANKPYGLLIFVLTGLVLSIPSFVLFYPTCLYVIRLNIPLAGKRIYLSLTAIFLTLVPFMMIRQNEWETQRDPAIYMFCYIIVIITNIWYYDIKQVKSKVKSQQQEHPTFSTASDFFDNEDFE